MVKREILKIEKLKIFIEDSNYIIRAVDDVSLKIMEGEFVGIIGESGAGKTQLALGIVGLNRTLPGIIGGKIFFFNENLLDNINSVCSYKINDNKVFIYKDLKKWKKFILPRFEKLRGKFIYYLHQESGNYLDPFFSIQSHIREILSISDLKFIDEEIKFLFSNFSLPFTKEFLNSFPFQLSGGMKQRIALILALLSPAKLIIADEPVRGLDAITQNFIVNNFNYIKEKTKKSFIIISHNISLLQNLVEKVYIMYGGEIIQISNLKQIFIKKSYNHPYVSHLLKTYKFLSNKTYKLNSKINTINWTKLNKGCKFFYSCPMVKRLNANQVKTCKDIKPDFKKTNSGIVKCHWI